MKKIFVFICLLHPIFTIAQISNEPGNNIGKSLSYMKQEFPNLRFLENSSIGDIYQDGYTEEGISLIFCFRNNTVTSECMSVESNDGFPRQWFDSMAQSLANYPAGFGVSNGNERHWCYSTFQVHLVYSSRNGKNIAMILYEAGGYNNGITGKSFNERFK